MKSFSNLGIILSCILGVIIFGLVIAELFYFLWWKKRLNKIEIEEGHQHTQHDYFSTELFNFLFFWKKNPNSVSSNLDVNITSEEKQETNVHKQQESEEEEDVEVGNKSTETLSKGGLLVEESIEAELIRLHNLCGPPRFLFTIKEETKEELESENAAAVISRTRKSLNELITTTPLTPPSHFLSPTTIKIASLQAFDHQNHGFNPLFESLTTETSDFIKLRSSPPPKFKFLRDAEEKLFTKLVKDSHASIQNLGPCSKVIPLATSPLTIRPFGLKKSSKK